MAQLSVIFFTFTLFAIRRAHKRQVLWAEGGTHYSLLLMAFNFFLFFAPAKRKKGFQLFFVLCARKEKKRDTNYFAS
jgi:hypothetical protein